MQSFDEYLAPFNIRLQGLSDFSQESKQTPSNWYKTKPHRIKLLIKAYLYDQSLIKSSFI